MIKPLQPVKIFGSIQKLTGVRGNPSIENIKEMRKRIKDIPARKKREEANRLEIQNHHYNHFANSLSEDPPKKTKKVLYTLYTLKKDQINTPDILRNFKTGDKKLLLFFEKTGFLKKQEPKKQLHKKTSKTFVVDKEKIKILYPNVNNWAGEVEEKNRKARGALLAEAMSIITKKTGKKHPRELREEDLNLICGLNKKDWVDMGYKVKPGVKSIPSAKETLKRHVVMNHLEEEAAQIIGVSLDKLGKEHLPAIKNLRKEHFNPKWFKMTPEMRAGKIQHRLKTRIRKNTRRI